MLVGNRSSRYPLSTLGNTQLFALLSETLRGCDPPSTVAKLVFPSKTTNLAIEKSSARSCLVAMAPDSQ